MNSPYFVVDLYDQVAIKPNQLNSDVYHAIKSNLIKKVQGRSNQYGIVQKVYRVADYSEGLMVHEDRSSSVFFMVKYTCLLCKPLQGMIMIAQIATINRQIINLHNGPVKVVVLDDYETMQNNNFMYSEAKNAYMVRQADGTAERLKQGDYVKVLILKYRMEATNIIASGSLYGMPTSDEIAESASEPPVVEISDLLRREKEIYQKPEELYVGDQEDIVEY